MNVTLQVWGIAGPSRSARNVEQRQRVGKPIQRVFGVWLEKRNLRKIKLLHVDGVGDYKSHVISRKSCFFSIVVMFFFLSKTMWHRFCFDSKSEKWERRMLLELISFHRFSFLKKFLENQKIDFLSFLVQKIDFNWKS